MLDMELFVSQCMTEENDVLLKKREKMKEVLNILISQCNTKQELDEHINSGRITEENLFNLIDNIEQLYTDERKFTDTINSVFKELCERKSVKKEKKRLL